MLTLKRFALVFGSISIILSLLFSAAGSIGDEMRIISVIIGLVIGILIFLWPKITKQKDTPQYDAKKLNETVYKKLMRVSCIYSVFLFGERLGFVIPSDERAFHNKKGNTYITWLMETLDMPQHDRYVGTDVAIPNLHVGEKYLKQKYNEIYKQWKEIKDLVDAHNKKHDDFLDFLGKVILEKICDVLPTFKDFETLKDENHANIIYLKNTVKLLDDFIQHNLRVDGKTPYSDKKRTFDKLVVCPSGTEGYWVLNHSNVNGQSLMFSDNKNAWDVEKIQSILNSILDDSKNIELYIKSKKYDYDELHDKIESFTDRLENEVVHDIENQL